MKLKDTLEKTFRKYFPKRIKNAQQFLWPLKDKKGLEIGGPSPSLSHKGFLPVYDVLTSLDGCNFGAETVWEGRLEEGPNYRWGKKTGFQFINDGSNLSAIKDGSYEVVLSCHSIEHFANPIKALNEWRRVLTDDGYILLVIPHKDGTFDHRRPTTTLAHLIADFENDTAETDHTHFDEIIALHDIQRDEGVSNKEELIARTKDNIHNRCVHHHVFNTPLVIELADHLGYQVIGLQHFNPFNIVTLWQKRPVVDNAQYKDPNHPAFQKFPSDKPWSH